MSQSVPQFVADEQFLAKRGAAPSSPVSEVGATIPPEPQTPPTIELTPDNEPATLQPPVPSQETAPPTVAVEEVDSDPFATELPGVQRTTEVKTEVVVPAGFEDLKPGATAPEWQHDAFNSIVSSDELTEEEKRTILEQKPQSWGKVKLWRQTARAIGRFADESVPLSDFFSFLENRSPGRTSALEAEAIERIASSPEKLARFAETKPQLYTEFLAALVTNNRDFVNAALKRQGLTLATTATGGSQILETLKGHEYYGAMIEGTEFETELEKVLSQIQAAEEPATASAPADTSDGDAQLAKIQKAHETLNQVAGSVWSRDVADGLKAEGIRPATASEIAANPVAAHLKNVIFNIAQFGLEGVVEDWEEQVDTFGRTDPSYVDGMNELQRYLADGEYDRFVNNARMLSPTYYNLGTRRAKIPLIRTLYAAVSAMFTQPAVDEGPSKGAPPDAPAPQPSTPSSNGTGFVADRIFLDRRGR